jgi:hypothetical protein
MSSWQPASSGVTEARAISSWVNATVADIELLKWWFARALAPYTVKALSVQ